MMIKVPQISLSNPIYGVGVSILDELDRQQKTKWLQKGQTFLYLTAQGINRSWTRVKYVLAIRELPGSHTADNINAATREILCEWEINQSRCHVFLRDGAANMKKVFEGSFDHADGAAHKLNLTSSQLSRRVDQQLKIV
uniref:Uncharacterized protein n=1 Tax=Ditylenchus dipsaci TaxID=166011 RepID=A0A915D2R6_9BILA